MNTESLTELYSLLSRLATCVVKLEEQIETLDHFIHQSVHVAQSLKTRVETLEHNGNE